MYRDIIPMFLFASSLWAQPVADPYDSVLSAYCLSPAESNAFACTASAPTAFWHSVDWASNDYVGLSRPDNCWPGDCQPSDDSVGFSATVYAGAVGESPGILNNPNPDLPHCGYGLYLSFDITDDIWREGSGADVLHIFLDKYSSAYMRLDPSVIIGYGNALSYSTICIMIPIGGDTVATQVSVVYYEPNLWRIDTLTATAADIRTHFGICVRGGHSSVSTRWVEVFIPWRLPVDNWFSEYHDLGYSQIAFSTGYDDLDTGIVPCRYRWLNKDPTEIDSNALGYWGNIQFEGGVGQTSGSCVAFAGPRPISTSRLRASPTTAGAYTLQGRPLRSLDCTHSVLVIRQTDGTLRMRATAKDYRH